MHDTAHSEPPCSSIDTQRSESSPPPSANRDEEYVAYRLERFIRQLAARGGSGRCYWNVAVWPAEKQGLIHARYEAASTPRYRNTPIRHWCYRVTLTEKGWALADALAAASAQSDAVEEVEKQP